MKRFWQISLPLSCCLLGAAIWTALLRQSEQLPPLHETWETARYLEAVRDPVFLESLPASLSVTPELPPQPFPDSARSATLVSQPIHEALLVSLDSMVPPSGTADLPVVTAKASPLLSEPAPEYRVSILQRPEPIPPTEHAPLPPLPSSIRPPLAQQDIQAASSHLSYGKTLARKGATASARGEFLNGLGVIAQARDLQVGGNEHLQALNRAVQALAESRDFYPPPNGSPADSDLSTITSGHLSQIVPKEVAAQMTRSAAVEAYHARAREELRTSCGEDNPIASELLYCLGKLHGLLGQADLAGQAQEYYQSLTFHQAALAADRRNYASANELGVLLAKQGRLEQAKQLFVQSVTLGPRRETWTNLATVHQRLGENELASLARLEAQRLEANSEQVASASPLIRLVAPAEFEAFPDTQDTGPAEPPAPRDAANVPTQLR